MNRALTWMMLVVSALVALSPPLIFVTADDPPTLILHGDADTLVPVQQSELVGEKLKKAGVETTLVIKKGARHGWPGLDKDLIRFADWFDEHLKKPVSGS
jgi:dipeptidyl aminopeptidase/acylaminoacyl peptidase